ncbi:MAG: hypothetical protein M1839_000690 [Geoglossum umbratile]|nr:MAG: hypothetical protein M1839_000690 [Geoglossum umbratile]
MTSRKRTKLLQDREEGMARVQRRLDNGELVIDRTRIDVYEFGWEDTLRPTKPIYTVPPPETKLLPAGRFANNAPTAVQRKKGLPTLPGGLRAAPCGSGGNPRHWRPKAGELHAVVQHQARSAIAAADQQYAYSLARYEMQKEIYGHTADEDDNPRYPMDWPREGPPPGPHEQNEDRHDTSDEDYEEPEDKLYDEWLRQLQEEGIDKNTMA